MNSTPLGSPTSHYLHINLGFAYCADKPGVIYLQGKNGQLADMDIDCDGLTESYDGDTRCDGSTDTQSQTSFQDELRSKHGISDLNAYVHSYVVFGNAGSKPGYVTFDPTQHGIEPLSVMAVVCNDQLFYGVWGDENGDDGAEAAVGEASIALASLCFGKDNVSGDNGHDEADVLYIAFQGEGAVTDAGVDWTTHSASEFQASLAHIGDQLVNQL